MGGHFLCCPLQAEKWVTCSLVPHRSTPMLCRTSQSYILAKKFVITQMGICYTKCRNLPLLSQAMSIKQAREVKHKFHNLKCALWLEPTNINTRMQTDRAWQRLHFSDRYKLSDWRFCACAVNVKSSMCSETTKYFWYKCHELFVNSPVMITVKSCLKCHLTFV